MILYLFIVRGFSKTKYLTAYKIQVKGLSLYVDVVHTVTTSSRYCHEAPTFVLDTAERQQHFYYCFIQFTGGNATEEHNIWKNNYME